MKGTSLETIESQTQQELYEGLENDGGASMNDPVGNMQLDVTEAALAQAALPVGVLAARWNQG